MSRIVVGVDVEIPDRLRVTASVLDRGAGGESDDRAIWWHERDQHRARGQQQCDEAEESAAPPGDARHDGAQADRDRRRGQADRDPVSVQPSPDWLSSAATPPMISAAPSVITTWLPVTRGFARRRSLRRSS